MTRQIPVTSGLLPAQLQWGSVEPGGWHPCGK